MNKLERLEQFKKRYINALDELQKSIDKLQALYMLLDNGELDLFKNPWGQFIKGIIKVSDPYQDFEIYENILHIKKHIKDKLEGLEKGLYKI